MSNRPSVSVCIATYNGERWIVDQLQSILPQLEFSDEVIIADDGSSDATIERIRSIGDLRIRILGISNKLGPTKNFERALVESRGEMIFLSDQDDIWHINKIKIVTEALKSSVLVMHDATIVDSILEPIESSYFNIRKVKHGLLHNIIYNGYTGAFMAFRREILTIAIPFQTNIHHDQWIGLIAELSTSCTFISEKLVLWRRHEHTQTSLVKKHYFKYLTMLPSRFHLAIHLICRMIKIKVERHSDISATRQK